MSQSVRAFVVKLLVIVLTIYVSFAVGYNLLGPRNIQYRSYHLGHHIASLLSQPVMEIAADGMMTRWYDWQQVSAEDVQNPEHISVQFISREAQVADYTTDISWANMQRHMGIVQEAAIIQPRQYNGRWTPIFCVVTDNGDICKQSSLYATGAIKMLIDGEFVVYAQAESGEYITLQVQEIIQRDQRPDLMLF